MITTAPPFAIALSENLFAYTESENQTFRKVIRILVWIFPLIISLFVYDMGKAGAVTGLTSYYMIFVSTAYCLLVSKRKVPLSNPY